MAEQEYFVRNPDSENARGPFTVDKLASLAEADQINRDSLVYDEQSETWKTIAEDAALCAKLFPERKKLTLRKRGQDAPTEIKKAPDATTGRKVAEGKTGEATEPLVEKTPESAPDATPEVTAVDAEDKGANSPAQAETKAQEEPVTKTVSAPAVKKSELSGMDVADLLAAAEGDTDEMELLREQKLWRNRAIALSLPMMALVMLFSAVGQLAVRHSEIWNLVGGGDGFKWTDWLPLLEEPRMILGIIDLILALLLGLAVTSTYPILRIRVILGLGYFGWLGFAHLTAGNICGAYEITGQVLLAAGIFTATITLRFRIMLTSVLCALAGTILLGLVWNVPGLFQ